MSHQYHMVSGYEEFKSKISDLEKNSERVINVYFTGSIDDKTGKSWCPDCVVGKYIFIMQVK